MILLALGTTFVAGVIGLRLLYPWILVDLHYLFTFARHAIKFSKEDKLYVDYFEATVKKNPEKVAIRFQDRSHTYKEVNENANKVARAAQSLGLKAGDTIALLMHNSPEYIWITIGLMKIGVVPSLINNSLKGKQLLHCINVSEPEIIVVGGDADLNKALMEILPDIKTKVYVYGSQNANVPDAFKSFSDIAKELNGETDIDRACRKSLTVKDPACYIFTSGTTGLPKPAIIVHKRVVFGVVLSLCCGAQSNDVWYVSLPLFHSNGLLLGGLASAAIGATTVLMKKFSKTNFMSDCRKYDVTVINYIGELFRFLLTNPESELDHQHKIRVALGNGLRQDIFQQTVDRFKIPYMREFYAATEGSIGFVNLSNRVGSCGRSSPFLRCVLKCGFYKYDAENECLVRDKKGHCIPVKQGDPGLMLGFINKLQIFDGYKGKKDLTENKLVRNVVRDGDVFFNSGDLMTLDKDHFLYFNDRIGDTFRWRGENISTTEVSNILTDLEFVVDACVYGVTIPGQDGKAGMAALLLSPDISTLDDAMLESISQFCCKSLTASSRPIFIRLQRDHLEMTSTIKQSKLTLKQEGFDMDRVTDPMFYFDKSSLKYRKLDKPVYSQIQNQSIQL